MILLQNRSNNKRTIVMGVKFKIVLLIFLSWFWSSGISAHEPVIEKSTDSNAQEWIMDEITVIGQSLHSLRMETVRAEDIKFEIFNSLNSTDDFDITCEYVAHTYLNSRIKRRECDVGYMKKAQAEDAYLYMILGIIPRSDLQLAKEFAHKAEALKKEMVELSLKHPSLAKAMINEIELKQRSIVERRGGFKQRLFIRK